MKPIRISWHAQRRMEQMGLDEGAITSVIADPEIVQPNAVGHPTGRQYVGGGIVVAVAVDGTVMTVLWRGADGRAPDGGPEFDLDLAS